MTISKPLRESIKLSGLSIANFKGISSCDIENFARVNLFLGKNDSGKSSIMEAVFFMFREYITNNLNTIMSRRTDVFTGGREIWFNYKTKHPIVIMARLKDRGKVGIRITMQEPQISTHLYGEYLRVGKKKFGWRIPSSIYVGTDFAFSIGKTKISQIPINNVDKRELSRFCTNLVFIDCRSKSLISESEKELARVKFGGKTRKFGTLLKQCYGKGINWEFIPHLDSPDEVRLTFKEGGKTIFASDLGDGFRLGLSILSKMFNRTNACFFIEEIESHQHSGSLKQLLRSIVKIARLNDLQLFMTTHSIDTWNSLSRGVYLEDKEMEKKEFRCFIVERTARSGVVTAEHTDDVTKIRNALGHP